MSFTADCPGIGEDSRCQINRTDMLIVRLLEKPISGQLEHTGNKEAAKAVGRIVAERAKEHGVEKVVFDRGGFPYHGVVRSVAEAAREAGLKF